MVSKAKASRVGIHSDVFELWQRKRLKPEILENIVDKVVPQLVTIVGFNL